MKVLEAAVSAIHSGEPAALATVIGANGSAPRHTGARMLVHADGSIVGTVGGGAFEHRAIQQAIEAIRDGRMRRLDLDLGEDLGMACGGRMELLIEPLVVKRPFHLFGAGHVGQSVARALEPLGFRVIVYDDRAEWANSDRFPGCELRLGDMVQAASELRCDENTWILIATRGHALDREILDLLVTQGWRWLGLMGSRGKIRRFVDELTASGVPAERLSRLSAPVGLDIGSETPEEIAVSIAAEIIACYREKAGMTGRLSEVVKTRSS